MSSNIHLGHIPSFKFVSMKCPLRDTSFTVSFMSEHEKNDIILIRKTIKLLDFIIYFIYCD